MPVRKLNPKNKKDSKLIKEHKKAIREGRGVRIKIGK